MGLVIAITLVAVLVVNDAVTGSVAGTIVGATAVVLIMAVVLAVTLVVTESIANITAAVMAIILALIGALAGATTASVTGEVTGIVTLPGALAGTFVWLFLGSYISWHILKGEERSVWVDVWIRAVSIAFVVIGGTNFRSADLSEADFTRSTLKSTDLRKANFTRTRWHQTKKLDRIHPGKTYLKDAQVRQLLITGQGQNQNFDRQNLRGVNLQGANLVDASFIGADLSEANLQDVDLSRAKLVQTQLDATDFTGATLTGAYIEDWNITSETNFHGVRCEYVYMRLPTKENPNPLRKPDNNAEVFANGEFGDFIQPIFDTLDLYHNQGVDPRAIAIAYKQLAENNPDAELEIVAMEKKGRDKFLCRLTRFSESWQLLVKPRETHLKAEGRGQKAEGRGKRNKEVIFAGFLLFILIYPYF